MKLENTIITVGTTKKRDMRSLSITRINAATRLHGLSYSKFINLLTQKNILIDRKSLAELAIREPEDFKNLVEQVKS